VPDRVVEILTGLRDAFAALGLRWYVFGAQAALAHGAARLTADVDVTVDIAATAPGDVVAALERHGFECRVDDVEGFAHKTHVIPLVHAASAMPVDVVVAGPGPEQLFLERAEPTSVQGVVVPMVRAEDLVVMKLLAGRPKDLDDVAAICSARALDVGSIRKLLAEFESALDRRDLLPLLDSILARTRR
jgi:hypothetical protein